MATKLNNQGISFPFHFNTRGRVKLSSGKEHIDESIKQILLTLKGERVMEPEFGSNLLKIVFESKNSAYDALIKDEITSALKRWETRINVKDVIIKRVDNSEEVFIKINYKIKETQEFTNVEFSIGGE